MPKPKTFDDACRELAQELAELIIKKQKDYGKKNISGSIVEPQIAIAVRIHDKLARLVNLTQTGAAPSNESLQDTALDIIGYGFVLKMVLDGTFELPLE